MTYLIISIITLALLIAWVVKSTKGAVQVNEQYYVVSKHTGVIHTPSCPKAKAMPKSEKLWLNESQLRHYKTLNKFYMNYCSSCFAERKDS